MPFNENTSIAPFDPNMFYHITHKEHFNTVVISGKYIINGPGNPFNIEGYVSRNFYVRLATNVEVILFGKEHADSDF
jgi:hypothetical protein